MYSLNRATRQEVRFAMVSAPLLLAKQFADFTCFEKSCIYFKTKLADFSCLLQLTTKGEGCILGTSSGGNNSVFFWHFGSLAKLFLEYFQTDNSPPNQCMAFLVTSIYDTTFVATKSGNTCLNCMHGGGWVGCNLVNVQNLKMLYRDQYLS